MQVFKYLPTPTFSGPLNNFVPVPYANTGGAPINHKEAYDFRIDDYAGQKDHIAMNIHYHKPIIALFHTCPSKLRRKGSSWGARTWDRGHSAPIGITPSRRPC